MIHPALIRHIDVLIRHVGWAVIKIVPSSAATFTPYAYTVGLTEHDLPELIISGLNPDLSQDLLNDLARRAHRTARPFTHLQTISDLLDSVNVVIIDGTPTDALQPNIATARYTAPRVRLQQIVWPDRHGRFPWQPGCTITPHTQPLLTHPQPATTDSPATPRLHTPPDSVPDVAEYASRILATIDADIRDGFLPPDVRTFTDLHDHVDANTYLQDAGVPYAPTTANNELTTAVQDAVTALLSAPGRNTDPASDQTRPGSCHRRHTDHADS